MKNQFSFISLCIIFVLFYSCTNDIDQLKPTTNEKSSQNLYTSNTTIEFDIWKDNYVVNTGWNVDKHVRKVADVNGDGMADIIGFHQNHVYVSLSTGTGFGTIQIWKDNYVVNTGWNVDKHVREVADVNGDGMADIIGFHQNHVYVSLSTGTDFDTIQIWKDNYVVNTGWNVDKHVRKVADVNGDGMADIIGFHQNHVYISPSTGTSFDPTTAWKGGFVFNTGWSVDKHVRQVADVDGNGKANIIGFHQNHVYVTKSDF